MTSSLTSPSFQRLVQTLKSHRKTLSVVEQCAGGTIQSSIMAQPGSSKVYLGGSIAYNTRKGKPLLLNDDNLHQSLIQDSKKIVSMEDYIHSKKKWTAKTSVAFCEALGTDLVVAEGGASGPTFGPEDMKTGFAVLSVAGKLEDGGIELLKQKVVVSPHNDRQKNMRMFADAAAELVTEVLTGDCSQNTLKSEYSKETRVVLDRQTHLRTSDKDLAELEPFAKYIVVKENEMLLESSSDLAFLSHTDIKNLKNEKNSVTFLGRLTDQYNTPVFAIDIRDEEENETKSLFERFMFSDVRTSAPILNSLHNELALHMMAYANWQRRSRFCSACGSPLRLVNAGTSQECTSCPAKYWPRQDPSMIASITSRCGQRILLARSKRHPPKLYTVLAGFVEAGETFENAVARETYEETGIRIDLDSVQYIGSQPWPFPQSCMIAFTATADDMQSINIDENELVDAKWFHKKDVYAATKVEGATMQHDVAQAAFNSDPSLPLLIPPKRVIARTLIDSWLERT